ncbi:MAG: hypothetical protein ACD_58C00123G0001 [uncultured bacterium]|nr:MAG: hypothetical protein ACD_58C00123G0001 [uncultured bacterium]
MEKTEYNPKQIESKWQKYWQENSIIKVDEKSDKPKFYCLDMFPYPSGEGLHVGHPKGFIATDVVARYKMLNGYNVLHPMGFDSFGLPAENYAIKNKVHPSVAVDKNITRYKDQLKMFGFTYDWDREVITSDPDYYKWTQWMFLQMFKKGLAYQSNEPINWCPSCKTGLANEDLEDGKCERCGTPVEKKPMRQWVLKITDYAERLLDDLKLVDWEDSIVEMQKNWIGRSEGALIHFELKTKNEKLKSNVGIFTTRPDTLFGATFMVIAPEHEVITNLKAQIENLKTIEDYIKKTKNKSELERTDLAKEKTGVEIKGIKAINPANNEEIPIYVADYVLPNYGTGAIMAVPAHDESDYEFAKKYDLDIKNVIEPLLMQKTDSSAFKTNEPFVEHHGVIVLLKHWDKDKYLGLGWRDASDWGTLLTGGIDDDLEPEKRALKEILEETGYKNAKIVKKLPMIHSKYYHVPKKANRFAHTHVFYITLLNDERDGVSEDESNRHELKWLTLDELQNFLTAESHKQTVNIHKTGVYSGQGLLANSSQFDGMDSEKAKDEITKFVNGKKTVQYKLKDWVFSRQRYWGEPIPLIHCMACGVVPVDEKDLPIKLPDVKNYKPTGTGESPLASIDKWVNVSCPMCGGPAKRETNTMPQWAGSSWYYLAYTLGTKNLKLKTKIENIDKNKLNYWMEPNGVDLYVGGAEHATRHLIYARFWHKFLYNIGIVTTKEPFHRLQHVGLINGEDGRKMSKRWGNVINPDDVIKEYGADALRCYEMFMGPFADSVAWSTQGVKGTYRFLERVWALGTKIQGTINNDQANYKSDNILVNQTIKKVTEDIENFRFNTAISALMILVNDMSKNFKQFNHSEFNILTLLLSPFAPHLAEGLWQKLRNKESIFKARWPDYDRTKIQLNITKIPVQINGKVRAIIEVSLDVNEKEIVEIALKDNNVAKYLNNQKIKKTIYIAGKILSIVI